MIKATNKVTGEVIELPIDDNFDIVDAWLFAKEYERVAAQLKDELKKLVPNIVSTSGTSDAINGHQFRVSNIQRMTYNKATMRAKLDPDVFDVLLKPDKSAVDKYLKENLETLGAISTELRDSMVPEGQPYQVIKLERLGRDA